VESQRTLDVTNPSTGKVVRQVADASAADVERAIAAAQAAFPAWRDTPPAKRAQVMYRFKQLLEEHADRLVQLVSEEHGKTVEDAMGELKRGIENVEYACGVPELLKGEYSHTVGPGIDAWSNFQPLGVVAGITPFNFPAMVPLWMYPMAIACGNTFIFKPSEKVPLTGQRLIELLVEAGLPPGVMNVVHGGKVCVDALLEHPLVSGVSFVGSSPVAKYIHETASRNGKRVQAAGGAKNFVFVMPDAEVGKAVDGMIDGAFGCAGQRCMAASTAVVVGQAADDFLPPLAEATRAIKVGPADRDSSAGMGALITGEHLDRVTGLIATGVEEGAELLVDGRGVKVDAAPDGFYLGPTIIDRVEDNMSICHEEVFGPVLNVMRFEDLDAAIDIANHQAFGNGACIYTTSGKAAREFGHRIQCGMIGINVGVPAPLAYFPFSGWNYSFFGDLHLQGKEAIYFYTRAKVITSRWFQPGEGDIWHKD